MAIFNNRSEKLVRPQAMGSQGLAVCGQRDSGSSGNSLEFIEDRAPLGFGTQLVSSADGVDQLRAC